MQKWEEQHQDRAKSTVRKEQEDAISICPVLPDHLDAWISQVSRPCDQRSSLACRHAKDHLAPDALPGLLRVLGSRSRFGLPQTDSMT